MGEQGMGFAHFFWRWMPSTRRTRRTVWFGALAVLAIAMVAAACSSSDSDDDQSQAEPEGPSAAQVQSQEDPPTPADSTSDDGDDNADDGAGRVRELTPVEADPDADNERDRGRRITVETGSSRGDTDGSTGTTAGELTEALGIDVSSGRFSLILTSDLDIEIGDGDPATDEVIDLVLGLLKELTVTGAFSADGNVELSIVTGPGAILPSLDLAVVDDEIYTNFGFGWMQGIDALAGLVGLLGDDFALDPADLDFDSLDLSDLDLGSLDLAGLGFDPLDLDSAPDAFLDSLTEVGIETIDGRRTRHLRGSLTEALSNLEDETIRVDSGSLDADIWLDVETEELLQFEMRGADLAFSDGTDGTTVRIDSLTVETRVDPEIGLPTFLSVDMTGFAIEGAIVGSGGVNGNIFLSFELTDINSSIVITAPRVS